MAKLSRWLNASSSKDSEKSTDRTDTTQSEEVVSVLSVQNSNQDSKKDSDYSTFQNLNVAVLLEVFGEDVWLISREETRSRIDEQAISFLPDEFEVLLKMDEEMVKGVFLVKKSEPKMRLIDRLH